MAMDISIITTIIALFIQSALALDCAKTPLTGVGAELFIQFKAADCGDIPQSGICPRQIVVESLGFGASRVLLAGNYSLLGSVRCESSFSNCSIEIYGSIDIGCCGELLSMFNVGAEDKSSISIGSQALFSIYKLDIKKRGMLVIGNQVSYTDTSASSVLQIGQNSTFAIHSTSGPINADAAGSIISLSQSDFYCSGNSITPLSSSSKQSFTKCYL